MSDPIPQSVPRTVQVSSEVSTWSLVSNLDPSSARGLLQLARVPVRDPVIATHVPHLPGALHPGAGLDLVLAVLQWHLHNLVIPGQ